MLCLSGKDSSGDDVVEFTHLKCKGFISWCCWHCYKDLFALWLIMVLFQWIEQRYRQGILTPLPAAETNCDLLSVTITDSLMGGLATPLWIGPNRFDNFQWANSISCVCNFSFNKVPGPSLPRRYQTLLTASSFLATIPVIYHGFYPTQPSHDQTLATFSSSIIERTICSCHSWEDYL